MVLNSEFEWGSSGRADFEKARGQQGRRALSWHAKRSVCCWSRWTPPDAYLKPRSRHATRCMI